MSESLRVRKAFVDDLRVGSGLNLLLTVTRSITAGVFGINMTLSVKLLWLKAEFVLNILTHLRHLTATFTGG